MIPVVETRGRAVLRGRLGRDRVASAYLLGDLDPRFFDDPRAIPSPEGLEVRRLGPADAGARLPVYADYPGHRCEVGQLDRGVYVGGFIGGRPVSVAGTHVHAPDEGVCALGNIGTAGDVRGRGHVAAVVARLVAEVREACPVVVLDSREDNAPARACYRPVGFEDAFGYLEAVAERR